MRVQVDNDPPGAPDVQLPPELRHEIRETVQGGLYRMGVGAGLIVLFIPLLALTIVAKVLHRSLARLAGRGRDP